MARNDEIEAGAKAIVEDLKMPGGRQKKLAKVVAAHLSWFDAAEARGMTWDDMIAVLAAAGARRKSGLPLSRGTLSSAVWRKRKDAAAGTVHEDWRSDRDRIANAGETMEPGFRPKAAERTRLRQERSATDRGAATASRTKSSRAVRRGFRGVIEGEDGQASGKGRASTGSNGKIRRSTGTVSKPLGGVKESAPSNENVLAYMKRAARLRQRSGDEN